PITVSLEWHPGATDSLPADLSTSNCAPSASSTNYLTDLVEGLRQMSAYLYTYSEGRMAIGNVKIYTNGEHWNDADIRILANSAYRPTTFVGGIVKVPTLYINPTNGLHL